MRCGAHVRLACATKYEILVVGELLRKKSCRVNLQPSLQAYPLTLTVGKVANGDNMNLGHCNCCDCELVAKHLNHNRMSAAGAVTAETLRTGLKYYLFNAITISNGP